jgi:hypothetical protein
LSFSVDDILDTDLSFVRTVYSYDAFTGDPLGRVFKSRIRRDF